MVARTLAQQQVPKMELLGLCALEETDAGWDRQRRRNGVTSVVTLADCICQGWPLTAQGCWLCDHGLPLCHPWALGQHLRATASNSGGLSGAVPIEGDMLLQPGG